MGFSVSYTTRTPRQGEIDGRDYTFVSEEEFRRIAARGGFAEWALVHGNLYGTLKQRLDSMLESGIDVVHDIDVQGARQMREAYLDAVYIFILPPSLNALRERLRMRQGDSEEEIRTRLGRATEEIRDYLSYDYVIVNDVLDEALRELESIVETKGLSTENVDPAWVEENYLRQEEG